MSSVRLYQAQPIPEPVPGDYGLVEMPGAPAHIEAMLLGWRFSHAVIYVGHGRLVEAWFDCVRKRSVTEYPARDISWFGVRCAPDGSPVTQSLRDPIAGYAVSRLGQLYDYSAWPAVYIRYIGHIDLSGLYVFDPLATCSGLVAKAYHAADLDLIDRPALNLVTPDDLDPESRRDTGQARLHKLARPSRSLPGQLAAGEDHRLRTSRLAHRRDGAGHHRPFGINPGAASRSCGTLGTVVLHGASPTVPGVRNVPWSRFRRPAGTPGTGGDG